MSIQYPVLGFKPTTYLRESPDNHQTTLMIIVFTDILADNI